MTCSLCGRPPMLFPDGVCARCDIRALAAVTPPPPPTPPSQEELELERLRSLGRPVKVVLVGCGAAKLEGRHQAGELYTGSLTRSALRWAKRHGADLTIILSARYHGLPTWRVVDSYNERLPKRQAEVHDWAIVTRNDIARLLQGLEVAELVALAGAEYLEPLLPLLPESLPQAQTPLAGKGIGERLRWLKVTP